MGSPLVQSPLGASPAITALGAGRIRGASFCGRDLESLWDSLDGTIRPSGDTTRLACALARQQSHSSLSSEIFRRPACAAQGITEIFCWSIISILLSVV